MPSVALPDVSSPFDESESFWNSLVLLGYLQLFAVWREAWIRFLPHKNNRLTVKLAVFPTT